VRVAACGPRVNSGPFTHAARHELTSPITGEAGAPASNSLSAFRQLRTPATARCGTSDWRPAIVGSKRQPRLSATAPCVSANPTGRGHHQVVLELVARLLLGSRGSPACTELPLAFRQLETLAPNSTECYSIPVVGYLVVVAPKPIPPNPCINSHANCLAMSYGAIALAPSPSPAGLRG